MEDVPELEEEEEKEETHWIPCWLKIKPMTGFPKGYVIIIIYIFSFLHQH